MAVAKSGIYNSMGNTMGAAISGISLFCIAALVSLSGAFGQSSPSLYYADVEFTISSDGIVAISGLANHPALAAQATSIYTSKKAQYWTFNMTLEESFSDFAYAVHLPEKAVINYIKTSTQFRLGTDGEKQFVKASGQDAPMSIVIQYTQDSPETSTAHNIVAYALPLAIAVIVSLFAYFIKSRAHKNPAAKESGKPEDEPGESADGKIGASGEKPARQWYNKDMLPERQRQIVEIIERNKGPVPQKRLETEIGIPKSSMSRNIDSLTRKGIIRKEGKGMSNVICLNDEKPSLLDTIG